MSETGFAVVGLGYVGLPVALALANKFAPVYGFDISEERVAEIKAGKDRTREVREADLKTTSLKLTTRASDLEGASFFVITVPTPIDNERRPDLGPIIGACEAIGPALRPGAVVVFESTVYPGLTREICGPLLAKSSGLRAGIDFKLGYSP
ncbi:MAG: NAD(P)-binding domain-containing protein, partial [Stellaceae bacterium]